MYSKLNSDKDKTPNESNRVSSIENLVLLAKQRRKLKPTFNKLALKEMQLTEIGIKKPMTPNVGHNNFNIMSQVLKRRGIESLM